ncbi:hypothetical protein HJG60_011543 [Phyllostomus discolor]|uniref:Uncharacterized protein n=1 Tax=Phyllostomus discolor TaxID=89673 RepID=A0A833ZW01_9CHIR|nr:hypothetical protein HJG60_011543 [Phyllostomus discolor]
MALLAGRCTKSLSLRLVSIQPTIRCIASSSLAKLSPGGAVCRPGAEPEGAGRLLGQAWAFELQLRKTVRLLPPGWGRRGSGLRLSCASLECQVEMSTQGEHPCEASGVQCAACASLLLFLPPKVLLPVVA